MSACGRLAGGMQSYSRARQRGLPRHRACSNVTAQCPLSHMRLVLSRKSLARYARWIVLAAYRFLLCARGARVRVRVDMGVMMGVIARGVIMPNDASSGVGGDAPEDAPFGMIDQHEPPSQLPQPHPHLFPLKLFSTQPHSPKSLQHHGGSSGVAPFSRHARDGELLSRTRLHADHVLQGDVDSHLTVEGFPPAPVGTQLGLAAARVWVRVRAHQSLAVIRVGRRASDEAHGSAPECPRSLPPRRPR